MNPRATVIALLSCTAMASAADSMLLQDFSAAAIPLNGDGDTYPSQYAAAGAGAMSVVTPAGAVDGRCAQLDLAPGGHVDIQFNPYNYAANPAFPSGPRAFARDYCAAPAAWRFDTYNRMRFWIKLPPSASPFQTDGTALVEFGTYVKRVTGADGFSDETGGNHWYHLLNIGPTGSWTQVVLDMHPDHVRGDSGGTDRGVQTYPTGEDGLGGHPGPFNYFDCLTRIYIQEAYAAPAVGTDQFGFDRFEFYRETADEPIDQVLSITATHVASDHRIVLTWSRCKDDNTVVHHVRYAFTDIHAAGWSAATPAPGGDITPPGWQGYNGMIYDTTALPLAGHSMLYLAIKPDNSSLFSQIAVPLDGTAAGTGGTTTGTTTSGTTGPGTASGGTTGSGTGGAGGGSASSGCGLGSGLTAALAAFSSLGVLALRRRR